MVLGLLVKGAQAAHKISKAKKAAKQIKKVEKLLKEKKSTDRRKKTVGGVVKRKRRLNRDNLTSAKPKATSKTQKDVVTAKTSLGFAEAKAVPESKTALPFIVKSPVTLPSPVILLPLIASIR